MAEPIRTIELVQTGGGASLVGQIPHAVIEPNQIRPVGSRYDRRHHGRRNDVVPLLQMGLTVLRVGPILVVAEDPLLIGHEFERDDMTIGLLWMWLWLWLLCHSIIIVIIVSSRSMAKDDHFLIHPARIARVVVGRLDELAHAGGLVHLHAPVLVPRFLHLPKLKDAPTVGISRQYRPVTLGCGCGCGCAGAGVTAQVIIQGSTSTAATSSSRRFDVCDNLGRTADNEPCHRTREQHQCYEPWMAAPADTTTTTTTTTRSSSRC